MHFQEHFTDVQSLGGVGRVFVLLSVGVVSQRVFPEHLFPVELVDFGLEGGEVIEGVVVVFVGSGEVSGEELGDGSDGVVELCGVFGFES
jgi:hypothetical protein